MSMFLVLASKLLDAQRINICIKMECVLTLLLDVLLSTHRVATATNVMMELTHKMVFVAPKEPMPMAEDALAVLNSETKFWKPKLQTVLSV